MLENLIRRRIWKLSVLWVVVILGTGCGVADAITDAADTVSDSVNEANRVIDNAIADLNRNSANWQNILQGISQNLPDDIAEIVREEAQTLATRSIGQTGAQFSCTVDHYANRAAQALNRLKQILNTQTPAPLPPMICLVAPSDVDLNTNPTGWDTITIHGYDMDHLDNNGNLLSFAMMLPNNQVYDYISESSVGRTTHYQITYSLRGVADRLYEQGISKIVPHWEGTLGGSINGEVIVKPWRAQRQTLLQEPNATTYVPNHVGGDRDFDTDGEDAVDLQVTGEISYDQRFVYGRVYMRALELEPDHTKVEGWSEWQPLYEAPIGLIITQVTPSSSSSVNIQFTSEGIHDFERPSGEVVIRFTVQGDHEGNEAGDWTRVTADWNLLNIELEETQPSWYRAGN